MAHAIQSLTDLDNRATVLSINGISAFDMILRAAMLDGLHQVRGGDTTLPFVLQFYSEPSQYFWTDDTGHTHVIHQGERGEQSDVLMPMLYALGQHGALLCLQDFSASPGTSLRSLGIAWVPSSSICKRHWISMPAYKSTWEKPKCGIEEDMCHQVARR